MRILEATASSSNCTPTSLASLDAQGQRVRGGGMDGIDARLSSDACPTMVDCAAAKASSQ
jgi:hypothetical protein